MVPSFCEGGLVGSYLLHIKLHQASSVVSIQRGYLPTRLCTSAVTRDLGLSSHRVRGKEPNNSSPLSCIDEEKKNEDARRKLHCNCVPWFKTSIIAICSCHFEHCLYNFGIDPTVRVPVFAIKYSSMATSLPASLPYPDSLIPPKGDSAAEEFPGNVVSNARETR